MFQAALNFTRQIRKPQKSSFEETIHARKCHWSLALVSVQCVIYTFACVQNRKEQSDTKYSSQPIEHDTEEGLVSSFPVLFSAYGSGMQWQRPKIPAFRTSLKWSGLAEQLASNAKTFSYGRRRDCQSQTYR